MEQINQTQQMPATQAGKSTKLPWAVAAVASIVAIAGLAFGIYGMTRPTETEKNETTKESDTATTAEDSTSTRSVANEQNPIIGPKNSNEIYTIGISAMAENYETSQTDPLRKLNTYVRIQNGKIESCEVQVEKELGIGYSREKVGECTIENLNKKIYMATSIFAGQEGNGDIAFILEDGTVYYIEPSEVFSSYTFTAKKLNVDKFVKNILAPISVFDGSGYAANVIVYSDNTFELYHESMKE